MSVGKASIQRAASAGTRKTTAKTTTKGTTVKASAKPKAVTASQVTADTTEVKQSVLTPMNCEEIQVKFLSGSPKPEDENRPVRLTEDMPVHLL